MLESIETTHGGGAPDCAVIWLHGLGADGHDFAGVVPQLGLPESICTRFVFPHAPPRPITLNGGMVMRGWFDITAIAEGAVEDEEGMRHSAELVRRLIAEQNEKGIATARIVLAGFSQGGALALYTALQNAGRLAGAAVLSAWLPAARSVLANVHGQNRALPIFCAHGAHDSMVPAVFAERGCEQLRAAGFAVRPRLWPMEHAVCLDELRDLGAWLARVLA